MKTLMMAPTRELMLTPHYAARRLGVSVSLLHKLCATGTGPVRYRYGKKVVFRQADLDAFAAAHRVAPTAHMQEPVATDAAAPLPSNGNKGGRA